MNRETHALPCELCFMASEQLLGYCRARGWAGHDPYDALNSPVLKRLCMNSSLMRFGFSQLFKRSPLDLRGIVRVPREQNPKGVAIFLSAMVRLRKFGLAGEQEVRALASRLLELRTKNYKRFCWGYHFDWQARGYLIPKGTPNIVCTTFAGQALLDAFDALGDVLWLHAAQSCAQFLLTDLRRLREGDSFCLSYTPLEETSVHNVNLLGAALLARLHSYQPSDQFRALALSAIKYSIAHQRPDGSWPYGEDRHQEWIDSFHTGYNLVALEQVFRYLHPKVYESAIEKGLRFYLDHFFIPEGIVKYYHDRTYPIDSHAIAQAIITLTTFREREPTALQLAQKVCNWALQNMRGKHGTFFYQRHRFYTNRIPYMRWCQAWMLYAMAVLQTEAIEACPGSATERDLRSKVLLEPRKESCSFIHF